jgi:ATP synthase protein I
LDFPLLSAARIAVMPSDNADDRTPGQISPADRDALRKRADAIGAKLETVAARTKRSSSGDRGQTMGQGMRAAADLIGGIVVGGVIGWYLDQWLGTRPWLLIVFFLVGFAAGLLNVIRQADRARLASRPSEPADKTGGR